MPPSRGRPSLLRRGWWTVQRWARANTFSPAWMPRRFRSPLVGYGSALLLQLLATALGLLLIYVFADFSLSAVPLVLVVVIIGPLWGAAPSLLSVMIGVVLFTLVIIPPHFTLVIPQVRDVWEFGLLMLMGFLIAITASQRERSRRTAEELATLLGQAHARAEQERLRLQQVLEVMPAGITITDRQAHVLEMNATKRILLELESVPVGQNVRTLTKSWRPIVEVSTLPRPSALSQALELGEAAPVREVEIETQNGHRKTILHSAAPIRDENWAVVGGVVVDMDITEQKRLEEALREANQQMDDFLGIASHELKTPLTALRLQVQAVKRRIHPQAPVEEPLARMEHQVRRLERLVNDLLDVSRIRAGKLELSLESADLAALVRQIVEEQRQAAPTRTITLHLPSDHAVLLMLDADRIGEVLVNYLTNALRYSPAEQPVEVGLAVEEEHARVWVRDHGPGIPAAEQAHIWERFHRVPGIKAQSGTGVGLGLGLSICREIIERHHGHVGVQSAPGHGSTFWFTLPLGQPV